MLARGPWTAVRDISASMPGHLKLPLALLAVVSLPFTASAQTGKTLTLQATPSTVAWGYYAADATPVLTVHSGDTVTIQTASTCGPPERLKSEGVSEADIPEWLGDIYTKVPK